MPQAAMAGAPAHQCAVRLVRGDVTQLDVDAVVACDRTTPAPGADGAEGELAGAVEAALRRADERGIARLAFEARRAGAHGLPYDVCARVMLHAICRHVSGPSRIREVVICLSDAAQLDAFQARLETML